MLRIHWGLWNEVSGWLYNSKFLVEYSSYRDALENCPNGYEVKRRP